jgi:hypothetical protein
VGQCDLELVNQCAITLELLEHRVDEQAAARGIAGEEG